jgi:hypothetical protein
MTLAIAFPSRSAGENRQLTARSRAAVAKGSSPRTTFAALTTPAASIVSASSTVASPVAPSG